MTVRWISSISTELSISGRAFNDAPGFISLDRHADRSVEVDLALSRSEALTADINDKQALIWAAVPAALSPSAVVVRCAPQLDTRLDLDETSINIRRFGVVKLPGEKASLVARFGIRDSIIEEITGINLESDVPTAIGQVNFMKAGAFSRLF